MSAVRCHKSVVVLMAALVSCNDGAAPSDASLPIDGGGGADPDCWPNCEYCNPFNQTACSSDQKCTIAIRAYARHGGRILCGPDGSRGEGESCSYTLVDGWDGLQIDNCAAGLWCHREAFGYFCRKLCDPDSGAGCEEGKCALVDDEFIYDPRCCWASPKWAAVCMRGDIADAAP